MSVLTKVGFVMLVMPGTLLFTYLCIATCINMFRDYKKNKELSEDDIAFIICSSWAFVSVLFMIVGTLYK